jgi:putative membrane protein
MMYWGNHMGTGDWVFSIFGTLIILALIVGLIVWLVSPSSRSDASPSAAGESAREILDRRLAGGEITVEQYRQLRGALDDEALTSDPQPSREPAGVAG